MRASCVPECDGEILPKIADRERLEANDLRQIESLARAGHVSRDIIRYPPALAPEVFRFLKSRSPVISLVGYTAEKSFIMNVPHRMLLGKRRNGARRTTAGTKTPRDRGEAPS